MVCVVCFDPLNLLRTKTQWIPYQRYTEKLKHVSHSVIMMVVSHLSWYSGVSQLSLVIVSYTLACHD